MANETEDLTVAAIQVRARRERVKRLMVRCMSASEIAETLGVSERTIKGDFAAIRGELAAELTRLDATTVASDIMARAETRQRELWTMLGQLSLDAKGKQVKMRPDLSNARLAILRELRAEARDSAELLQKLGIVYQAPQDIRVGLAALDLLAKVSELDLRRIARAPAEDFERLLGECVGAEEVERLIASGDGTPTDTYGTIPD